MKKRYLIFALTLALTAVTSACEDDFLDVNRDINNPSDATIDLVYPAGAASAAFVLGGHWQILGSFWAQHWTQATGANQFARLDNYDINEDTFEWQYSEIFAGSLMDLQFVSDKAEESGEWNYFLMSEVTQVYVWQVLVDLYDKVPYFEALHGGEDPTPPFDEGQAIYDDLIARLDNALSKDRSSSTVPGKDDVFFEGDMDQWVKFANTLKLKIFMRQTEARPSVAETGITSLFAGGAMFLDDTDAQYDAFAPVENYENPYYAVQVSTAFRGNVDVAASNTLMLFMQNAGDPRVDVLFAKPRDGGPHVGLDQGDYSNSSYATARKLSQPDIRQTTPVVFMSVAESKFLQAEAVVRYGVAGDAKALYEEGIEAAFSKLGVSGAAALYADAAPYAYDGSTTASALESILTQKWAAMANFQGLEAHFEHLRTGYPDFFTVTPNNVTGGILPKRLPYSSAEVNNNREELNAIGGQRTVLDRIWWDPS